VVEALLALVLIDHVLQQRAQCQDVQVSTPDIARLERASSKGG
jgi:chorismate synthase